jgi:Acetyltransferase (GNAT) domain
VEHAHSTRIRVIDPVDNPLWSSFVQVHPDAGIFHHPAWLRLLRDQYHFKTMAICAQRNEVIVAGIPFCEVKGLSGRRKLVCLPFSDHCGPLASTPQDLEILLDYIRLEATRNGFSVQVRTRLGVDSGFAIGNPQWLHVTRIDSEAGDLLKSFKSRVQQPIKKAPKLGLTTEIRHDFKAFDIFWRLHLMTRRRQGVPIQPRRYFRLFYENIIARNLGFVAITRHNAHYVSAGVFCGFKDVITYKYGASDPAYLHLSPTQPMLWATMLYAKEGAFSRFDFGKTALSNEGLRQFKNGWNATEMELAYSYFPSGPSGRLFDVLNTNAVVPIIRRSPQFVCQLAGEMLYKYFGG